jgi:hypothetical protein
MKKIQKITLLIILLISAFAATSFAQECEPKSIAFTFPPESEESLGDTYATVTGKTGGCNRFRYLDKDKDERTEVTLTSTDGKARFQIKSVESGKTYTNLTSFNQTITAGTVEIIVTGTASTVFTLKVIVFSGEEEV